MADAPTQTPQTDSSPAAAPPAAKRGASGWLLHGVTMLVVAVFGVWAHKPALGYGMLGFDSYLQIAAARIENWNDFLGTFRERLTNGHIAADFYRPIQNLSIALDYYLNGIKPFGYQLSTLIVLALVVVLIYSVSRRILGAGAWIGPIVGALFFAWHPSLLDVVPLPCRRSELLTVAFLLLALLVLSQKRAGFGIASIVSGFCVLFACGAKEIGVMGVGLVFIHQAVFMKYTNLPQYIGRVVLATIPALFGAGLYIANRTYVIKGLAGGYRQEQIRGYSERAAEWLPLFFRDFFCPWSFLPGWSAESLATFAACFVGGLVLLFLLVGLISRDQQFRGVARLALLGTLWIGPPLVLLGAGTEYRPWYLVVPLVGLALVLAALVHAGVVLVRRSAAARVAGAGVLLGMACVLTIELWASPAYTHYDEWRIASDRLEARLADLDKELAQAETGRRLVFDVADLYKAPTQDNRPTLGFVPVLSLRAVRAYCQLEHPDMRIRVVYHASHEGWRPRPDEILLQIRKVNEIGDKEELRGDDDSEDDTGSG